jgi:predicted MFS family arabinose efflux permease
MRGRVGGEGMGARLAMRTKLPRGAGLSSARLTFAGLRLTQSAMQPDSPSLFEWRRGWRIVLGAALGSALGMPLFYYVFSLFTLSMTKEFGVTRGAMANVQAILVIGALFAPLVGRLIDRRGFLPVFTGATLVIVAAHVLLATSISTLGQFAVIALLYGAAGVGCGPLAYTRPVNAWFWHSRGLALGVVGMGIALSAAIAPPLLAALIEEKGWRAGFLALALLAMIGLACARLLVREAPAEGPAGPVVQEQKQATDRSFFGTLDFWLLVGSIICISIAGAGLISQMSPLLQEEGLSPVTAALGVTGYAVGQVGGRLIAGWFLDRANPQVVAFVFTFVPALGFLMLGQFALPAWAAIAAVAMVGVQHGAEIDLFAWFTARRFGFARYGTVYGWIIAASWIGNAVGIIGFGRLHDATASYAVAEQWAAGLLILGAVLLAAVRAAHRRVVS